MTSQSPYIWHDEYEPIMVQISNGELSSLRRSLNDALASAVCWHNHCEDLRADLRTAQAEIESLREAIKDLSNAARTDNQHA